MSVINILLWVVVLIIMPMGVGAAVCRWLAVGNHPAKLYLVGTFSEWALFQLVTVPMIWYRVHFRPLWIGMTIVLGLLAVLGWALLIAGNSRREQKPERAKPGAAAIIVTVIMILGYLFLAYELAVHQRPDKDDARFVAAALDIVNSDTLFLVDPSTGLPTEKFVQDFQRDAVAPYIVYTAYVAQVTGTHAAIIAHSVLQQSLMLAMLATYWLLGERFFPGDLFAKSGMVILVFLMIVFGDHIAVLENVALWRVWQGKAVQAAIGVPFTYWVGARIEENPKGWKAYLLLYIMMLAFCFLSITGYLLGILFCVGFGIAYGIRHKSLWVMVKCCLPTALFAVYYWVYTLYA